MNSLFNSALKQSLSVKRDLDTFSESPVTTSAALLGQISASLASFSRIVEDYDSMARREPVPAKQEKALLRVKNFRKEIQEYKTHFEKLKSDRAEAEHTHARSELLGRRGHSSATPDNPYAYNPSASSTTHNRTSSLAHTSSAFPPPANYQQNQQQLATHEDHLFRERDFTSRTHEQLDEFLDRGRSVLHNLGEQKAMLKNTQRKLYSVANTLGISRDTIRMIERRATQDKWIFYSGVVVFFLFCYFVLRWLH
ncbi:putative v-SNARE protein Bos1 [Terfezia boudieri ATCC MYA-4762]|uniref:Protein transport protein BOS1 n=1 Tax=Terfezia boudieri ATCC MYA-4762 TaxID=1051890 RepID=A0A3N4LX23_9PEZI|nr:putative v-SNARE protein Bos1 [Terfezia boudieri ATCC MYA-4762]